jgi:hypothetical protein
MIVLRRTLGILALEPTGKPPFSTVWLTNINQHYTDYPPDCKPNETMC